MFVSILGRQPELSLAELKAVFGDDSVSQVSSEVATINTPDFDLSILGGTVKYGQVIHIIKPQGVNPKASLISASNKIIGYYTDKWQKADHKITLGISAYGLNVPPRDVQKTGLLLKSTLKKHGVSLRLIPNSQTALSTATSHNNKLGLSDNKVELLIIHTGKQIIIAESCGAQNITTYARRDQNRPKRDAFVGMLPPKLAQIMLNLAIDQSTETATILDPFCGTGVILQESLLRGFDAYGTDLNPKMIDYTRENLAWLQKTHRGATGKIINLHQGDAMTTIWQNSQNISAVICETYLGQPFSAPPSPQKLKEVVRNCDHIITEFLKNIHPQLKPNTPLCIAIPAWQDANGRLTHLPLLHHLEKLGYTQKRQPLIYARPDQIVAREILSLQTIQMPKSFETSGSSSILD